MQEPLSARASDRLPFAETGGVRGAAQRSTDGAGGVPCRSSGRP